MDGEEDFELEDALLDAIQDAPALPQEDPKAAIDSFLEEDALLDALQEAPTLPPVQPVQPLASDDTGHDLELARHACVTNGHSTVAAAIASAAQDADDEFDRLCAELQKPQVGSMSAPKRFGAPEDALPEKVALSGHSALQAASAEQKLQSSKPIHSSKQVSSLPGPVKAPGKGGKLPWRGVLFVACSMFLFWMPSMLWAEDEAKEAFVVREPRIVAPKMEETDFINANVSASKRGSIESVWVGSMRAQNMSDQGLEDDAGLSNASLWGNGTVDTDFKQKRNVESRRPGGGQRRKGRSAAGGAGVW